ncbi:MAG: hypothetical protein AAF412_15400, partial [Pseudomonadota bacterium]
MEDQHIHPLPAENQQFLTPAAQRAAPKSRLYCLLALLFMPLLAIGCQNNGTAASPETVAEETPSPRPPIYDAEKTVFCLNMLSNVLFNVENSMDYLNQQGKSVINAMLADGEVKSLIGNWEVAWGPEIFVSNSATCGSSCAVDNLLVLFRYADNNSCQGTCPPKYVLATSGTNSLSNFGWFDEDFKVNVLKKWPAYSKTKTTFPDFANLPDVKTNFSGSVAISIGTQTGIDKLFKLSSGKKGTIYKALKDIAQKLPGKSELSVVGHSLGGALAPTVALAL